MPKKGQKTPIEVRFWAKVDKTGECWLWTAGKDSSGYGSILYDGRVQTASRVVWMLEIGPIPEGMLICHTCDTPACVRPSHLFMGTNSDNAKDAAAKGRRPKRRNGMCKNGHLVEGDNAVQREDAPGYSRCRKCHNASAKASMQRHRDKVKAQRTWNNYPAEVKCVNCGGSGQTGSADDPESCTRCHGTGIVTE